MTRIYISLPINGRKESTFSEKYAAARRRCADIEAHIRRHVDAEAEIVTPFDVTREFTPEGVAIGKCVTALYGCDIIALDADWRNSKGCQLERYAAMVYGKGVMEIGEGE